MATAEILQAVPTAVSARSEEMAQIRSYISNLPIGTFRAVLQPEEEAGVPPVDINNLPDGIVTGSNLIHFSKDASPDIKSSVALSLLAAQKVASNDPVVLTPKQWLDRHNTVLTNLNWQVKSQGELEQEFTNVNVAVHEAVIPFLTAAFGGVAAGVLITTALKQLKEMDNKSPWITLFDRESSRFNVTEYQFSGVQVEKDQVTLKLASARFAASFGKTQVLFVKVTKQRAQFVGARGELSANTDLLIGMNGDLKTKLARFATAYIQKLPF